MTRRMEIELTSRLDDAQWTWRAAGAKLPKGTLDAALVPGGAKSGDVLRAEYESTIDGIDIVALAGTKAKEAPTADRIELAPRQLHGPEISVTYAPKGGRGGDRRRGDRNERGDRRDGPGGARGSDRGAARGRSDRRPGGSRPEGAGSESRGPRPERGERRPERSGPRGDRGAQRTGRPARPELPQSTVHRNTLLAELGPEQLPIAEQLLRGGLPAVRQAIAEQDAKAKQDGSAPADATAILTIADELVPQTALAAWKDRAASVQAAGQDVRLRELRTVVSAARTVTMDEEGRSLLKGLRESLEHRINAMVERWTNKITAALDEGRLVDALSAVAQPPDVSTRCPAELAVRLADATSAAMTAETAPADWLTLLTAVSDTPVRSSVKPVGIPDDDDLRRQALSAAGLVPGVAKLLGLRIPPPPPRRTVVRRAVTTD